MALSEIKIYRDFRVVDGYVQVQPNFERDKRRIALSDALGAIPGSTTVSLSLGSGPSTGSKFGVQRWLRLPGLQPGGDYPIDPARILLSI